MSTRRAFLGTLAGTLVPVPRAVWAQSAGRMARVGFLAGVPREQSGTVPTFVATLRGMGFIEGQNLVVEWRHGDTEATSNPKRSGWSREAAGGD